MHRIAFGGMAEIYLARTSGIQGFEKYVVLKRILPNYAENPEKQEFSHSLLASPSSSPGPADPSAPARDGTVATKIVSRPDIVKPSGRAGPTPEVLIVCRGHRWHMNVCGTTRLTPVAMQANGFIRGRPPDC